MKKKTLIIFIVLLAVVFLATNVYAGGKKHKRWWKGSFHYVWKAVSDLQDRVEKLEEKANEPQPQSQGGPAPTLTFLCPNCDFFGANLTYKDFSRAYFAGSYMYDVDLTGTNLSDADLSRVVFYNANLTGADFTGAVLSDCLWYSTICPDGTNSDDNGGTCMDHL